MKVKNEPQNESDKAIESLVKYYLDFGQKNHTSADQVPIFVEFFLTDHNISETNAKMIIKELLSFGILLMITEKDNRYLMSIESIKHYEEGTFYQYLNTLRAERNQSKKAKDAIEKNAIYDAKARWMSGIALILSIILSIIQLSKCT